MFYNDINSSIILNTGTSKIFGIHRGVRQGCQMDLTIFGRVLLSKAEGLSRFVYPALSMYVSDDISKDINKSFLDFIWKNKPYQLKMDIISGKRVEGGLEMIDFFYINNTFKLNWLRNCLQNDNSMWFFTPQCIF